MKFARALFMGGVLLALTAPVAIADTAAALKALDPDNDGTIDLAEAQAGAKKKFAALNPDNDGTLDEKEYAAVVEAKFKAANPDDDGTIDLKELSSPAGQELLKLIY